MAGLGDEWDSLPDHLKPVRGYKIFDSPVPEDEGDEEVVSEGPSELDHVAGMLAVDASTRIVQVGIFHSHVNFVRGVEAIYHSPLNSLGGDFVTLSNKGPMHETNHLKSVLTLQPGEEICSIGYVLDGTLCNAMWLRTSAHREIRAGTRKGKAITWFHLPRSHELVAFRGNVHYVLTQYGQLFMAMASRPGFVSAPRFWRKFGLLVMQKHSLGRDSAQPADQPPPPGLDEGQQLLWRVVCLNDDVFRGIMMKLRYAWSEEEAASWGEDSSPSGSESGGDSD